MTDLMDSPLLAPLADLLTPDKVETLQEMARVFYSNRSDISVARQSFATMCTLPQQNRKSLLLKEPNGTHCPIFQGSLISNTQFAATPLRSDQLILLQLAARLVFCLSDLQNVSDTVGCCGIFQVFYLLSLRPPPPPILHINIPQLLVVYL